MTLTWSTHDLISGMELSIGLFEPLFCDADDL